MPKLSFVVLCLALCAGTALAQTPDLLLTEYVEGSGNNKALEVFNGTEDVINLGGYSIEQYTNGSTISVSIALDAVDLYPGDVFVVANPLADPPLLATASQTSADINFNGDDALVLTFGGGTIIDSFGVVGEDPGSYWSCTEGNTANHTLRRLSSICEGDTVTDDVFDPCDQWSFVPVDVFSGLGAHIADCGAVVNEATGWGSLKMRFR